MKIKNLNNVLNCLLIAIIVPIFFCCEKESDLTNDYLIAKIVDYDRNCSTCILSFPSELNYKKLGPFEDNFYHVVNLNMYNFRIGQLIKVKVRKAENGEIPCCIALNQSFNFEHLFVTDYLNYSDFEFNDTIDLPYKKCVFDPENAGYICFDSVLTDSRCPLDVNCIWAGEAIARFRIENQETKPIFVDLHLGTSDSIVGNYRISFIDLFPYPISKYQINTEDYIARVVIKQK